MKSLETRARAQAEFIDVYHAHSWIGTGPNAELYALSTQKEMTTVSEPLEPPHSVFLLALVNFGRIGSVLLILCVLSFYRKRARLADLILLAPLFIFSVFDHYLWSTWSGQVLGALTFFLIFGKIFHTESWHSHNEFANSHKLTPFSMNVRPLSDRVIVKPLSKEQSTASGIIIPDTVDKERPEQGEVIAVGPGRRMDNGSRAGMDLKVGDKIVFKKYSPDEIKVGDEEVLVISESDVMAVLEN